MTSLILVLLMCFWLRSKLLSLQLVVLMWVGVWLWRMFKGKRAGGHHGGAFIHCASYFLSYLYLFSFLFIFIFVSTHHTDAIA